MKPVGFTDANGTALINKQEQHLAQVHVVENDVDGRIFTKWEASMEQRRKFAATGVLYVSHMTQGQPLQSIALSTTNPFTHPTKPFELSSYKADIDAALKAKEKQDDDLIISALSSAIAKGAPAQLVRQVVFLRFITDDPNNPSAAQNLMLGSLGFDRWQPSLKEALTLLKTELPVNYGKARRELLLAHFNGAPIENIIKIVEVFKDVMPYADFVELALAVGVNVEVEVETGTIKSPVQSNAENFAGYYSILETLATVDDNENAALEITSKIRNFVFSDTQIENINKACAYRFGSDNDLYKEIVNAIEWKTTFSKVRLLVDELKMGHRMAIKAELDRLGVKNLSKLDLKQLPAFVTFLEGLKTGKQDKTLPPSLGNGDLGGSTGDQ